LPGGPPPLVPVRARTDSPVLENTRDCRIADRLRRSPSVSIQIPVGSAPGPFRTLFGTTMIACTKQGQQLQPRIALFFLRSALTFRHVGVETSPLTCRPAAQPNANSSLPAAKCSSSDVRLPIVLVPVGSVPEVYRSIGPGRRGSGYRCQTTRRTRTSGLPRSRPTDRRGREGDRSGTAPTDPGAGRDGSVADPRKARRRGVGQR
jgi:hypothetical protein